jgi:hypothetical protein
MREPELFHPIEPVVPTEYPEIEKPQELEKADAERRSERRRDFEKDLRKRIAKKLGTDKLDPNTPRPGAPLGMKKRQGGVVPPTAFAGKPAEVKTEDDSAGAPKAPEAIQSGDSLAARARRLKKGKGGPPG